MQIVHSSRRGARDIEHIGSAHDQAELEALKQAARQRLAAGQTQLDLGLDLGGRQPLPIASTRMGYLWDALGHAYQLRFAAATGGDELVRALVLARILEPTSKLDSLRVIDEAGIDPPSYATLKRRLPTFAQQSFRTGLAVLEPAGVHREVWLSR